MNSNNSLHSVVPSRNWRGFSKKRQLELVQTCKDRRGIKGRGASGRVKSLIFLLFYFNFLPFRFPISLSINIKTGASPHEGCFKEEARPGSRVLVGVAGTGEHSRRVRRGVWLVFHLDLLELPIWTVFSSPSSCTSPFFQQFTFPAKRVCMKNINFN